MKIDEQRLVAEFATADEARAAGELPVGASWTTEQERGRLRPGDPVLIQVRFIETSWQDARVLNVDGESVELVLRGISAPDGRPLILKVKREHIVGYLSEH